jgi:hypothetical protein
MPRFIILIMQYKKGGKKILKVPERIKDYL